MAAQGCAGTMQEEQGWLSCTASWCVMGHSLVQQQIREIGMLPVWCSNCDCHVFWWVHQPAASKRVYVLCFTCLVLCLLRLQVRRVMVRRLKKDVLKQLPPKRRQVRESC
jgi:hypothetical protein